MIKSTFYCFIFLFFSLSLISQKTEFNRVGDSNLTISSVLESNALDGFVPVQISSRKDKLGRTHMKYKYFRDQIPLEGIDLNIHLNNNGEVYLFNGSPLHAKYTSRGSTTISDKEIRDLLSLQLGGDYEILDNNQKSFLKNIDFSKALAKVVYFSPELDGDISKIHLCYEIIAKAKKDLGPKRLFVSAETGELIKVIEHVHGIEINVPTLYYGNQDIEITQVGSDQSMVDDVRNITTYYSDTESTDDGVVVTSTMNFDDWLGDLEAVKDIHYGSGAAYDYFDATYDWQSFDGAGAIAISSYYLTGVDNAFYSPMLEALIFGDGGGPGPFTSPLSTLEIAGHEFMHGIINSTGSLFYGQEPGAINESYSDIFGMAVQDAADPALGVDWLIGEECTGGVGIRSFSNPGAFMQPDCYGGPFYQSTTNGNPSDEFGVHTNSGVMNYWFYLLNVGGNSTNCNSEAYDVKPASDFVPGSSDAFGIMTGLLFSGLVDGYVGLNTKFADMREATDEVAHDLGYSCAFRENLLAAWHAVGVGPAPNGDCEIFPDLSANLPPFPCTSSLLEFSVTPSNNDTYTYDWEMGDGNEYLDDQPTISHTYLSTGSFTVTVTLTDNSMGPGNEVTAFDQFALSILPDCDPDTGNDCSANAGPADFLCFGETEFQLNAPNSIDYANPPNVTWSVVGAPGGVDLVDINIVAGVDDFTPTVNYGGLEFPKGPYVFEMCVDCAATTGGGVPIRKCSQSAVITVSEPPSIPEIYNIIEECSQIIIEVEEPNIDEEWDFIISSLNRISVEYVPGVGIQITRDENFGNSDYWRNTTPYQYLFTYVLIRNGCALQSDEIELTFVDTQYALDGEVDARISELQGFCYGLEKRLDGSRPGFQALAEWRVLDQPIDSNLDPLYIANNNGDVFITFEEEGWYTFQYTVSQNDPCQESSRTIEYYFQDQEIIKPPVSPVNIGLCAPLTEATTYTQDIGLMDNVIYQYNPSTQPASGTIEIVSPNSNVTDIIVSPGPGGELVLNNGFANVAMTVTQYLFKPNCNESFIEVVPLPFPTPEENFENLDQILLDYITDYVYSETSCLDGVPGDVEIGVDNLNIIITVDGLPLECADFDPCYQTCFNQANWNIAEGGILQLAPDLNIFCDNGSSIYQFKMSQYINSPTSLDGQEFTITVVEDNGVTFQNNIQLNSNLLLPDEGTYVFLVELEYYSPTGILLCADMGFFTVTIGAAFDPCAGDDQEICPVEVFVLNGCTAPPPFTSLEGTWTQTAGSLEAYLVDIHDPNTAGYLPFGACNEMYTFEWSFSSSLGNCDDIVSTTNVQVLADGDGTCSCGDCVNVIEPEVIISWDDESNGIIEVELNFTIVDIDDITDILVDFQLGTIISSTTTILNNDLQWVGIVQLENGQSNLCFGVDFQTETTCHFEFCEDICTYTNGDVCPVTEPCTEELDITLADIDCATNSEGDLIYEFDIRIWDPAGLAEPLTVISSLGTIIDVVVDPDYNPSLPQLTRITGILVPSSDITGLEACFTIQFANQTLCDISDCGIVPECPCAISNEIVNWPECIYPLQLTCFEMSFDYYGPTGQTIDFYLDESNSSYGWDLISATNVVTGLNVVELGTNTFNLCFIYDADCKEWGIDLFFDAVIEGVECKLWEMHELYCCEGSCTDVISATFQDLDCATNSEGELLYEFDIRVWDDDGLVLPLSLSTADGSISNIVIDPDYNPSLPELTRITGLLTPSGPLTDELCILVDYENEELCDEELCLDLPECPCAISNIVVDYPDCIDPFVEFCVPVSFDYYGPVGQDISFYLENSNSTDGFDLVSATNINTGVNTVDLGTNEFLVCFIFEGTCSSDGALSLFFDAVIDEVECKLWEMTTSLTCCDYKDCKGSKYSYELECIDQTGLHKLVLYVAAPSGYSNDFIVISPELLGYTVVDEEGTLTIEADLDLSGYNGEGEQACFTVNFIDPNICNVEICFGPSDCPEERRDFIIDRIEKLEVSPNPFSETINAKLRSNELGESEWIIYDINGSLVYHSWKTIDSNIDEFKIDLADYNSGVYYLKIILPNGNNLMKKIIKIR